jgi:putative spermidine/putrescine transport system ATP-binding protein
VLKDLARAIFVVGTGLALFIIMYRYCGVDPKVPMREAKTVSGQALILNGITHRYGGSRAVDNVTLDIKAGEMVALLGPSGCGKTTLLRIIAGFIRQSEGTVMVGGDAIDALPPHRRNIGIVFQNYALFPHMSVADNIAYGLAARGESRAAQAARVSEMLDLVKLAPMADRYPRQLSGGQQQRIALARALAMRPAILLLDEPFAALDKNLRLDMQIEIKSIQRLAGTTTIIVTHDQEEALSMADRVAVLSQGKLEQFAPATQVYDAPTSFFVNTFVGASNVLDGVAETVTGDRATIRLGDGSTISAPAAPGLREHARVKLCIRPEHLVFAEGAGDLDGTVALGMPLGSSVVHEVRLGDGTAIKVAGPRDAGAAPLAMGTRVSLRPTHASAVRLYPV